MIEYVFIPISDVCYTLKGRSDALYYCRPHNKKNDFANLTISILHKYLCDGTTHCHNAEDETHPRCELLQGL